MCAAGHAHAIDGGIMLWGMLICVSLERLVGVNARLVWNMKDRAIWTLLRRVAPVHSICFLKWKWSLQAWSMSEGLNCTGLVLKHRAELQLASWSNNLPHLNVIEFIWERKLRAQKPPCQNILDLHDLWCNLSLTI